MSSEIGPAIDFVSDDCRQSRYNARIRRTARDAIGYDLYRLIALVESWLEMPELVQGLRQGEDTAAELQGKASTLIRRLKQVSRVHSRVGFLPPDVYLDLASVLRESEADRWPLGLALRHLEALRWFGRNELKFDRNDEARRFMVQFATRQVVVHPIHDSREIFVSIPFRGDPSFDASNVDSLTGLTTSRPSTPPMDEPFSRNDSPAKKAPKAVAKAVAAAYELLAEDKPLSVNAACKRAGVDRKNFVKRYPKEAALIRAMAAPDKNLPHATRDWRTGNWETIDDDTE
ncbi:hypothetical protein EP7_000950 [Isosphaeraceae bacterium EP7]